MFEIIHLFTTGGTLRTMLGLRVLTSIPGALTQQEEGGEGGEGEEQEEGAKYGYIGISKLY